MLLDLIRRFFCGFFFGGGGGSVGHSNRHPEHKSSNNKGAVLPLGMVRIVQRRSAGLVYSPQAWLLILNSCVKVCVCLCRGGGAQ